MSTEKHHSGGAFRHHAGPEDKRRQDCHAESEHGLWQPRACNFCSVPPDRKSPGTGTNPIFQPSTFEHIVTAKLYCLAQFMPTTKNTPR